MAFVLKPNLRVLCGHIGGADRVALRDNPSAASAGSHSVDNGEAVAIVSKRGEEEFYEVERQDGVRGFVRAHHLHVQSWPLSATSSAQRVALSPSWAGTWVWVSGPEAGKQWRLDAAGYEGEGQRHPATVLTPHAIVVANRLLLLALDEHTQAAEVVLWSGGEEGRALPRGGPSAAGPGAPRAREEVELSRGWSGVFTWAQHVASERVGLQWAVTREGRYHKRAAADAPPERLVAVTPTAWHAAAEGGSARLYLLDGVLSRCLVWDASTRGVSAVGYLTVLCGVNGAAGSCFECRAGRRVLVGSSTQNGGGVLLRSRPDASLESDGAGPRLRDGDEATVLALSPALDWAQVGRDGVGGVAEGWLGTRHLHVQAHHAPVGLGCSMPHVPGLSRLSVPRPAEWVGEQSVNLQLVPLEPASAGYASLVARVRATVPSAAVVRVDQVQNVLLWTRYFTERQLMHATHGDAPCERLLWHGTGSVPPSDIFNGQEGFDMRFCSEGQWGIASYFAEQAGYSNAAKYVHHNERGQRELLLARVLVGRAADFGAAPDPTLRMPPRLPGGSGLRYDSVSAVGGGGGDSRVCERSPHRPRRRHAHAAPPTAWQTCRPWPPRPRHRFRLPRHSRRRAARSVPPSGPDA